MLTLQNCIPPLHHFFFYISSMHCLYQAFSLHGEPFPNLQPKVILVLSDLPLLGSAESAKPQSPSKRLSVSRGIKQLFQSATKFVRLLQR